MESNTRLLWEARISHQLPVGWVRPPHGQNRAYASFTVPIWILIGSISTASATRQPEINYPGSNWESLTLYARFPQGIPPGLERSVLESK